MIPVSVIEDPTSICELNLRGDAGLAGLATIAFLIAFNVAVTIAFPIALGSE